MSDNSSKGAEEISPQHRREPLTLFQALRYWLLLGFTSFGGPAGQIAMMHTELVERRRWISERRFLHALNYCMLLPGPEAQQLATYIGWLMHGTWGGVLAGALFVLPSLFIISALAWLVLQFGGQPLVAGLLKGVQPVVVAVVVFAAWRIGSRALKHPLLWGIAGLAFIGMTVLKLPFPLVLLLGALGGMLAARWVPALEQSGSHGSGHASASSAGPAILDDHTPIPEHARWSTQRLAITSAVFLVLWAAVMALASGAAEPAAQGLLSDLGWFFTKAALLTFGGAYAVLPYVYQGAVEQFQWLTAEQMMNGLALGEATPGPLIMIVAWVGFIAGSVRAWLGPELVFMSGLVAASVATFFTFLPSFWFILAGGPFIESTRQQWRLAAPLAGISAAVVGVIGQLALFFAGHVLWPEGIASDASAGFSWGDSDQWLAAMQAIDIKAALIMAAGFWALLRVKMGIVTTMAIGAAVGAVVFTH